MKVPRLTGETLTTGKSPPSLAGIPGAVMEWWFVQGRIDGGESPDLYFMCAFFQGRVSKTDPEPGHMLLLHLVRSDGTPVGAVSRVSPRMIEVYRGVAERVIESRFPRLLKDFLLRRHLSDLGGFANDAGIEFPQTAASVRADKCAIEWDGFSIREEGHGLRLIVPEDAFSGLDWATLDVRLTPQRPWLCEEGPRLSPHYAPPFQYYTCPRLTLEGTVGGRLAKGSAWVDRQWGSSLNNWFLTEKSGVLYPMGWDWLGLTLDNGLDFMVIRLGEAGNHGAVEDCVVRLDDTGASKIAGRFVSTTESPWISRLSGAAYPLKHRLYAPEYETDLLIEPVAQNQEIPVFGTSPVWEGAVVANGHVEGQQVQGHGRLELFGYGYRDGLLKLASRALRRSFSRN